MLKKIPLLFLAAALVGLGAWLAWQQGNHSVTIRVDGVAASYTTREKTVGAVLAQAGLDPAPSDQVIPALESVLTPGLEITIQQSRPVRILADGKWAMLSFVDGLPGNWLAEAGVALYPGDQVLLAGIPISLDTPLDDPAPVLQVRRAVPITVEVGGVTQTGSSTAPTLGAALASIGVTLRAADWLVPDSTTWLAAPIEAELFPAREVLIQSGALTQTVLTPVQVVGEVLAAAGMPLQGLDYSIPAEDQPVPADNSVRVVPVWEEVLLEQEPLAFETQTQPDPTLELDQQSVIQAGEYGLSAQRIRVRYEDGVEITRTVDAEWVAVTPKPRIIGYGTQIVIRTVSTAEGSFEYWRAVDAYATSYSNCRLGIPNYCNDRTASGALLKKGVVAFIRSWYNAMAGGQVYVPGYGVGVVADIGGGVSGRNWIDLGYNDADWVSWSQNVTIYFLTPVPPADRILYILP